MYQLYDFIFAIIGFWIYAYLLILKEFNHCKKLVQILIAFQFILFVFNTRWNYFNKVKTAEIGSNGIEWDRFDYKENEYIRIGWEAKRHPKID